MNLISLAFHKCPLSGPTCVKSALVRFFPVTVSLACVSVFCEHTIYVEQLLELSILWTVLQFEWQKFFLMTLTGVMDLGDRQRGAYYSHGMWLPALVLGGVKHCGLWKLILSHPEL